MADKQYHVKIVDYLLSFLSSNTCFLILGTEDAEVAASILPSESKRTTIKARHIVNDLHLMINATKTNLPITWYECCENACATNFKQITQPKTVDDWYMELTSTKGKRFK